MDSNRCSGRLEFRFTQRLGLMLGVGAALGALAGCSSSTTNTLPDLGCSNCTPPPSGDGGNPGNPGADGGSGSDTSSAADSPPVPDATTTTQNDTWADGKNIAAPVIIAKGITVTISPGAKVTLAQNITITVDGTLTASSASSHASLSGTGWGGIIVGSGGTLTLDGVDITDATTAIETQSGDTSATYNDGTITGATTPFLLDTGSTFSTTKAVVTGTKGNSHISGAFTASHLSYDSQGNEGLTTLDATSTVSIEDSTLYGTGPYADMLVTNGAASVHVAYTEIKMVHCGFHFNSITKFDISYTTDHSNAWGAMLYGSDLNGHGSITFSNMETNNDYDLDKQGSNGPITVDSSYMTGTSTPNIGATNPQSSPVAGAMPRP
jgi:hypothetical protein